MRLTSDGLFAVLLSWSATAGSLLANGLVHHAALLAVTGAVMTAICPVGVVVAWLARRARRGP